MHGQVVLDAVEYFGALAEERREAAGGDHPHRPLAFPPDLADNPFDKPYISPVASGLHEGNRLPPDALLRFRVINIQYCPPGSMKRIVTHLLVKHAHLSHS